MHQSQIMEDDIISAVRAFARSIKLKGNVVADMSSLISATSQLPLSHFDYWERLIRTEFSLAMTGHVPSRWKLGGKSNEILTWLDLTSWDGYKREKTLRTLSGAAPNTFFFSLSLRRLNDWVPQVREAARDKLLELAKATNPEYVVEALCIALSNWGSWGRIEEKDKNVLLQIISEEHIAESFRKKIMSSTSGPMTSLFSQLGRTAILDGKIDEIARFAIQPSLRAKAYRSLFEGKVTWIEGRENIWMDIRYCKKKVIPIVSERKVNVQISRLELLKSSAKDPSSVVRRVSADVLIQDMENLGDIAIHLAIKFLSDKSEAVAERGRFAVKKLENLGRINKTGVC